MFYSDIFLSIEFVMLHLLQLIDDIGNGLIKDLQFARATTMKSTNIFTLKTYLHGIIVMLDN